MFKLYGGFIINGRTVRYEPPHPDAVWCVVCLHKSEWVIRGVALAREVEGGWEQVYSGFRRGIMALEPYTIAELEQAELDIVRTPAVISDVQWLVRNSPLRDRNTTGTPYLAPAGSRCCRCDKRAFFTLSAYRTQGSTSHVLRHFCRRCLKRGPRTSVNNLICHVCRRPGADRQILELPGDYRFRVHDSCAAAIPSLAEPKPTREERRPQRRVTITRTDPHAEGTH